jgi:hypothetical protein
VKHFRLIRAQVDVTDVLAELSREAAAWLACTGRQEAAFAQRDTNAIPLRGLRKSMINGRRRRDVHESRYTTLSRKFPATVSLLETLAETLGGRLGRAKLALLPPGKRVLPHVDRGEYYRHRDRYHLVLRSEGGSRLRAGGEEVAMQEGELWWFDNKALHSADNRSGHDRIHLIFDLLPAQTGARSDDAGADPARLLRAALAQREAHTIREVASAVETYLAVRERPAAWGEVLSRAGLLETASSGPLVALAQLHWPALTRQARRRCESALAWTLAQIDLGRVQPDRVEAAIRDAGGLDVIDVLWRDGADQELYGELIAEEAARAGDADTVRDDAASLAGGAQA